MDKYLAESYYKVLDALYDTITATCNHNCFNCEFKIVPDVYPKYDLCSIAIVRDGIEDKYIRDQL